MLLGNIKRDYDVIIAGAGPAGLECAYQLDNSGLTVLLIEKNKIIGPKTCAGGLTYQVRGFDFPEDRTRSFSHQQIFLKNKKYEITLVNPLKTITRLDLGQHLLNRIKNSGNIKILTDTSVSAIEKNKITTNKGIFHFKYLVGADGSNSTVRRHLGLKPEVTFGFYYEIPNVTGKCIWYLNFDLLNSGYIWVFPHKEHTNIGIFFNPVHLSSKKAREILNKYLTDNHYEFSEDGFKAAPENHSYSGCVFNNIFLSGDAAGLASKATGEGISFALISGREIGKKILNPDYKMAELKRILTLKKRQERFLKIFEMSPRLQRLLFRIFVNLLKTKWFQSYIGN